MKKIGIYLSMKPHEGGKYQYTLTILNALSDISLNKYELIAFYHDNSWESKLANHIVGKKLRGRNIFQRIIRKFLFNSSLLLWRYLGKYLDPVQKDFYVNNLDLVFFPGNDSLSFEMKLSTACPIFDLMHLYEKRFSEISSLAIIKLRNKHYNRVCKYSNLILVDSKVGRDHVMESFSVINNKIFILPYIAPPYVRHKIKNINLNKKHNIFKKYIFYPAQFWGHKNHFGLIKAISVLKTRNIIINAIFVGSSKNTHIECINMIKKYGLEQQIIILDYVSNSELVYLFKNANSLVMPTFLGPTNIPQLEAFALGCPVLTSNIYGIPEQVGDAALLFDPNSINDIANKIEMVWNDDKLRLKLIEKGFAKDLQWNQLKFNDCLESVISDYFVE
jgi:glycosyltransferase involved in cell wall biosynthesis